MMITKVSSFCIFIEMLRISHTYESNIDSYELLIFRLRTKILVRNNDAHKKKKKKKESYNDQLKYLQFVSCYYTAMATLSVRES